MRRMEIGRFFSRREDVNSDSVGIAWNVLRAYGVIPPPVMLYGVLEKLTQVVQVMPYRHVFNLVRIGAPSAVIGHISSCDRTNRRAPEVDFERGEAGFDPFIGVRFGAMMSLAPCEEFLSRFIERDRPNEKKVRLPLFDRLPRLEFHPFRCSPIAFGSRQAGASGPLVSVYFEAIVPLPVPRPQSHSSPPSAARSNPAS